MPTAFSYNRTVIKRNTLRPRIFIADLLHPLHPDIQHFQINPAGPAGHVDGWFPFQRPSQLVSVSTILDVGFVTDNLEAQ